MVSTIAERWQELNEGSNLAKAAETVFINFRSDSQAALNKVGSSFTLFSHCFLKILFTFSSLAMSMN